MKPPRVWGHAFQFTAKEAKAAPGVVIGMFSFVILPKLFYGVLMFKIHLGTFLVNSLPDLVLFDSVVSQSFVSRSLYKSFGMTHGKLECLLWVSIANKNRVSASSIFCDCTLEIFGVSHLIDLIHMPTGDVCVILGMNWLSRFDVMIDCEG